MVPAGYNLSGLFINVLFSPFVDLIRFLREQLYAYAGPVVQAFRRPWCIDSGLVVHAFR